MTFDTISISSDDDEVPLRSYTDHLRSDDLRAHSIQPCEFCDEVYTNRYKALIHNAKHIIIPLLKQEVHQCTECLYYFTSQNELTHHKTTKHKLENNLINDKDKYEKSIEIKSELHMAISDIVKKELDIKLEDYIHQDKLDAVKVTGEIHNDCITRNQLDIIVEEKLKNHLEAESKVKISNRIRFESDSDPETEELANIAEGTNGVLNDLVTECKVNVNLFDKPWVGEDNGNATELVVKVNGTVNTKREDIELYTQSTHYDDLLKPGMYRCKRCGDIFPTRFQLIQHDTVHVKMRKPRPLLCIFCERFISTNRAALKQHIQVQHPSKICVHKQYTFPTCKRCGLKYYNYLKHMHNYHPLTYCHVCKKGFETEDEKTIHVKEHLVETKCDQCDMVSTAIEVEEHRRLCHRVSSVAMLKLCETCCLFLKNRNNMQYAVVNSVSELGTRLDCERCGKKFFELKLVRRLHMMKEREPKERKRHLTNSDRLKNIQQRLKMFNKLSRC